MAEVYKISVLVSLTNQISSVLGLIARDFAKTDAQAVALKNTLKEIKFLGASGLLIGGIGFAGLKLAEKLVKPASDYLHQLNIMNMAGLTQVEIAEAVGDAWKNTRTVITTTATENLRMLLDLRNVIGEVNASGLAPSAISMEAARKQLPVLSMMQQVMASSSEAGINAVAKDNFAFTTAKALDIIGAATSPEKFEEQAAMMARVITAFQGRVTPAQFQGVFQYARQAKYGLSNEFKYEILPSLMLEASTGASSMGGGSRGVGPMLAAFNRYWVQGLGITKKTLPELQSLGFIDAAQATKTTTGDTNLDYFDGKRWGVHKGKSASTTNVGAFRYSELALSNPFKLVQEVVLPAILKKFGGKATPEQINAEIVKIGRGNQLATQLMLEFALKATNFFRDQKIIRGADDYKTAYQKAMRNDPEFAYIALAAQWENLKIALGISIVPSIVNALTILTKALNWLAIFFKDHEDIAKGLTWAFVGLSGAMAFTGTVLLLTAGFKAMKTVLTAGGLVPALLGAKSGVTGLAAGLESLILVLRRLSILLPLSLKGDTGPNSGELPQKEQDKIREDARKRGIKTPGEALSDWWNRAPGPVGPGVPGSKYNPATQQWESPPARVSLSPISRAEASPVTANIPPEQTQSMIAGFAAAVRAAVAGMTISLDGKKVGEIVSGHQADQASRPLSGSSQPDLRMTPLMPGLPAGWIAP